MDKDIGIEIPEISEAENEEVLCEIPGCTNVAVDSAERYVNEKKRWTLVCQTHLDIYIA